MYPRTNLATLLKSGPFAFPSECRADSVEISLFWPEGSQRSQSHSELQGRFIFQLALVVVLCWKSSSARVPGDAAQTSGRSSISLAPSSCVLTPEIPAARASPSSSLCLLNSVTSPNSAVGPLSESRFRRYLWAGSLGYGRARVCFPSLSDHSS